MELPIIVEHIRSFANGWSLMSCNLNPYSELYSDELEAMVQPYIDKKYHTFTVTGTIPEDMCNMEGGQFVFIGDFCTHPKYGNQFKADFFYQDVPATEDGLTCFLMSLPNIKESRSKAIVSKFGVQGTFDILNNDIYRLTEINGITVHRIPAIEKAWQEKKCLRELYEFLVEHGISHKFAEAIYKKWGPLAKQVIIENPYRFVELRGVGFVTADKLAHQIMDVVSNEFRTIACLKYILEDFVNQNSNLCIPYEQLKSKLKEIIGECDVALGNKPNDMCVDLIPHCIKSNLDVFMAVKDLETKITYVYLKDIWEKEVFISKELYKRSKSDHRKSECGDNDIAKAEKGLSLFCGKDIKLDETQMQGIRTAFDHKVSVITGGGGTGKSSICRCIFELAQEKELSIRMMSPTGKAAQVLEAKTGCGASTIHRGLKMVPGEDLPREDIVEDILLIDEASMCGVDTMYAMLKAMESNIWGNIVFVGDKNQLPSVAPGNFLSDIIESGCANVVTLDKIHRQSEDSYISLLANDIAKGKVVGIPVNATDIKWHNIDVDNFESDILKFVDNYLKKGNSIEDLQIMSPMKKGLCGVYKINEIVQRRMATVNGTNDHGMKYKFTEFFVGDRVIQVENDYDKMVFNGDMGVITDLGEKIKDSKKSDKKEKFITVSFYGDEISFYGDEIEQIHLAWAITVHKFQGSQCPNILLILASEASMMMSKELVYTAFTRAEKQLDIFGNNSVFRNAPTKSAIRKRYTNFTRIVDSFKQNKRILSLLGQK
jgi:exodeoxyribonuclease V alpha subunit